MSGKAAFKRGCACHDDPWPFCLDLFLKVFKRSDRLHLFECKWVVIYILMMPTLEVHPIKMGLGDVESVTAHMLQIDNRLLLFSWLAVLILEALAPAKEVFKQHKHVQDAILA